MSLIKIIEMFLEWLKVNNFQENETNKIKLDDLEKEAKEFKIKKELEQEDYDKFLKTLQKYHEEYMNNYDNSFINFLENKKEDLQKENNIQENNSKEQPIEEILAEQEAEKAANKSVTAGVKL